MMVISIIQVISAKKKFDSNKLIKNSNQCLLLLGNKFESTNVGGSYFSAEKARDFECKYLEVCSRQLTAAISSNTHLKWSMSMENS